MTFLFYVIGVFALNVLTPGASFILTLQTALTYGRAAGVRLALGLSTCDFLFACAASFGMAALLKNHSSIGSIITFAGGLWVMYLGLKVYLRTRVNKEAAVLAAVHSLPTIKAYKTGLSTGIMNAQAIIFFATIFVGGMIADETLPEAIILAVAVGITSVILRVTVAIVVTIPTVKAAYYRRKKPIEQVSGVALMAFGLKMSGKAAIPFVLKLIVIAMINFGVLVATMKLRLMH